MVDSRPVERRIAHRRWLLVGDAEVETDSEGYLAKLEQWSEDFARAQAAAEGVALTAEHWEVIRYLRDYFHEHGVQAQVRAMIRHSPRPGARSGATTITCTICFPSVDRRSRQPPGRIAADQGRALSP